MSAIGYGTDFMKTSMACRVPRAALRDAITYMLSTTGSRSHSRIHHHQRRHHQFTPKTVESGRAAFRFVAHHNRTSICPNFQHFGIFLLTHNKISCRSSTTVTLTPMSKAWPPSATDANSASESSPLEPTTSVQQPLSA